YAVHPSPEMGEKYFRPWIGAAMETGYSVNPHWVADLRALPNHPISNGVPEKVEAFDEFYYAMRFQKERKQVLNLVSAIPTKTRIKRIINLWNNNGVTGIDKEQSLMWGVERQDGGRGVGFVGGHYHRNWANDGFRKIVLNAIVWVAGAEVPEDGVNSKPVSEDQLNQNLDVYPGKENPRIKLPDIEAYRNMKPADWEAGVARAAVEAKKNRTADERR
ncbi:MAG: ThuA domain-containing protein, partial [Planctomycetota bacterium]